VIEKVTTSVRGGDTSTVPVKAILGVVAMAAIEGGLKKIFNAANIKFPSQLGGCMVLFAVAVLAQIIHPGWGDSIQSFLEPGSALLSKWMPCFFVPGLAMFPLAPSIGSGKEVCIGWGGLERAIVIRRLRCFLTVSCFSSCSGPLIQKRLRLPSLSVSSRWDLCTLFSL